jgi:hypothetical protein
VASEVLALAPARTEAGGVRTVAEVRVLTEGTDRLTVVSGRLTRPLGAGTPRDGAVNRDDELLGRVKVRGDKLGIVGVVVTVEPRKVEGRLYLAEYG